MLVGKLPFEIEAVKSTLTRFVKADYVMPSYLSDNTKDLIDWLLKKNPKEILKHPFIEFFGKQRQVKNFLIIYKNTFFKQ